MRRFTNRTEAGRELAAMLNAFAHRDDVIVLGLPRGGVPVAFEVAKSLGAPLDVFSVCKLRLPDNDEYAIGAIATGDITTIDWRTVDAMRVSDHALQALVARGRRELERKDHLYRGDRPPPMVTGRTVIVVDDGIATGDTVYAAILALRKMEPARIIVAAPVVSHAAEARLRLVVDALVCADAPSRFFSVGAWYDEYAQTTDADVVRLLASASALVASPQVAAPTSQ